MNNKMIPYYLSRILLSGAFGALLYISGTSLWSAILLGGSILALFLWAPHSGRYSVHPEFGVSALRRDERTQIINDKAARNAFIASILSAAAIVIYFNAITVSSISIGLFKTVLVIGVITYFVSDMWLRKSHQ